ncbi:MAG: class I SAM-dependent rRNA methyltransferase [Bacteroidaceae bacterium]|nr:class I SAM-dependent rRNA methyltransferase [Bacteroidaceae bacterium]
MTHYPAVSLKRGKEESVLRRHPWIFSGAVKSLPPGLAEGDTVSVLASDGTPLGTGYYQIGSIAVRMYSFSARTIDTAFFCHRIAAALRLRRALGLVREDNNALRLVHGEGDRLPGLVVDLFGATAVVQAHTVAMHRQRQAVADALKDVLGDALHAVYYKSEGTLPFKANTGAKDGYLLGGEEEGGEADSVALENGLRFRIDWLEGQKTGFFVDQRDNRDLLRRYAQGRNVLNMCCYTGGFSVYALAGGAERVCSVDSSSRAVELTDENVRLNFPDTDRHEAVEADAFRFLQDGGAKKYDLVVLDPPAFAKHRDAVPQALRGYTRLNELALRHMPAGSLLFTFSCSQAVSRQQFRLAVFTAAARTRRHVSILHQLTQPADHPVSIYHPEGEYLKGLVLYVE